ncbi:HHL027Cp [Eremothecium sinecaudum]|uniref:ATP-dependent (S)-NAD(P)H-hydrate dehydratase n=1 Tax=Eremothecium sinecaudum TaxID=45286 RepID=A0A109V0S1_9SACH|nr:HHL027Cp [Eremothecium sinecaudum]AMD22743.1 HHL027Cp [Eremothecium sinecaudum]
MLSKIPKLSHQELIKLAKDNCVPKLSNSLHKGQYGRLCVVGGCQEYTGAPYFAANAAALTGIDMVHIICEWRAATAIKSYSPNIMVHPYLRDSYTLSHNNSVPTESIRSLIDRIDVLVMGPGMGRDTNMLSTALDVLRYIVERHDGNKPVILDADALFLFSHPDYSRTMTELITQFKPGRVVLTPNLVEMRRTNQALQVRNASELAAKLHCTILEKGPSDTVYGAVGGIYVKNDTPGSPRRPGGQGDTLSGCVGALLASSCHIHDLNDAKENVRHDEEDSSLAWPEVAVLSCYAGSTVTRTAAARAFRTIGRSMQATDVNSSVAPVISDLFDHPTAN